MIDAITAYGFVGTLFAARRMLRPASLDWDHGSRLDYASCTVIATYSFLSSYLLIVIILYTCFSTKNIWTTSKEGVFAPLNIQLCLYSNHGPVGVGFEVFNIPYSGWEYSASSILPQVLLYCLHHTELVYQKCQSSILKKYKTIQIKSSLTFALQKNVENSWMKKTHFFQGLETYWSSIFTIILFSFQHWSQSVFLS